METRSRFAFSFIKGSDCKIAPRTNVVSFSWGNKSTGLEHGWVYKKIKVVKNLIDSVNSVDPVKNPVATYWLFFYFLSKRYHFDLLKKLELTRVTRSKLMIRVLDRVDHRIGFKNIATEKTRCFQEIVCFYNEKIFLKKNNF